MKDVNRRDAEFDASEKRLGIPKEVWAFGPSPKGSMVVIYFEADDIGKVFSESCWNTGFAQELFQSTPAHPYKRKADKYHYRS